MRVSYGFSGMLRQIFSDSGESGVFECLVESVPCHRQSLPLQPLLQDPQCYILCPAKTLHLYRLDSIPCRVVEEEDPKCGVVSSNFLWNFETK